MGFKMNAAELILTEAMDRISDYGWVPYNNANVTNGPGCILNHLSKVMVNIAGEVIYPADEIIEADDIIKESLDSLCREKYNVEFMEEANDHYIKDGEEALSFLKEVGEIVKKRYNND